ncbi:MAG: hypothetical protein Q9183_002011 [Haloplaca sp. 2 TL-2023]
MPPKAPRTQGKQKPQDEGREESLQAVVLADTYETRFLPFTREQPRCLLPLANTPLIEYTLEFLAGAGVEEVYLCCGSQTEQLEKYLSSSKWKLSSSPLKNLVLLKSDATSIGDAMRDIDSRGLITGDFLLVSGDVVSNVSIQPALAQHRGRREKEKDAIMTMVLREAGVNHRTKARSCRPVFVVDPTRDRCLHYEDIKASATNSQPVTLDPDLLSGHAEIDVREDLIDCNIDICTPDVLSLWSDNFDYQSLRTSFLFGVLKDYELNGKTIHVHIIADQYAARVQSLAAYDAISKDIAGRWSYPLCPDSNRLQDQTFRYTREGNYQEKGVILSKTSRVTNRCVLGQATTIAEGATLRESTLGRGCRIGRNVVVEGSYLWSDVVVGENSTIKNAILANGVVIGNGCSIDSGALISYNVRIADGTTISGPKKVILPDTRRMGHAASTSVAGERGGEDYEYLASSDEESDSSDLMYRNLQASASSASVSTLQSEDSEFELEDTARRASFVSETSDESAANKDFYIEATANILEGLQKEEPLDTITLELNSFRMSVDASQHEVRRAVASAFTRRIANLESGGSAARDAVHRVFSHYKTLVERTIFDKESDTKPDQIDFLLCVQKELVNRDKGANLMLFIAKEAYDLELVEEDGILQWWADQRSSDGEMVRIRALTQAFITFLEDAEEEDESEEDEDKDEDDG